MRTVPQDNLHTTDKYTLNVYNISVLIRTPINIYKKHNCMFRFNQFNYSLIVIRNNITTTTITLAALPRINVTNEIHQVI